MSPQSFEGQIERFESQWGDPENLSIDTIAAQIEPESRNQVLAELVLIDLEKQFQSIRDEAEVERRLADYFRQYPELSADSAIRERVIKRWEEIRDAHTIDHSPSLTSEDNRKQSSCDFFPPCDFGEFRLNRVVGHGGMGVVYEAQQKAPTRTVAIKVLHADASTSGDMAARFEREIELVGSIEDPGVVPIYESGVIDGHRYFVMPLMRGGSLQQRIQADQLSASEAAKIMIDLARSVSAAHRCGVVHRDIKPGNVLFGLDGKPRISDFGLSRHVDQSHTLTRTGQICGTPGYIAPERIAKDDANDDEVPSDIYALGAVLYDMLCGRPPFRGANMWETLSKAMSSPPVSPAKLNHNVGRDLDTICLKCLEREPSKRYESCDELVEDLTRYTNGQAILARPINLFERAVRYAKMHPSRSGLIAACASLIVVAIAIVFLIQQLMLRDQQVKTATMLRNSEAYYARIAKVGELLNSRPIGWRDESLQLLDEAARYEFPNRDTSMLRSQASTILVQRDLQHVATLSEPMWCDTVTFNRQGTFLALGQNKNINGFEVHIYSVERIQEEPYVLWVDTTAENIARFLSNHPKPHDGARSIEFSPDGKEIAIGTRHGRLHRFSWDGKHAKRIGSYDPDPTVEVSRIEYSNDGKSIWTVSDDNKLRIVSNDQVTQFAPLGDQHVYDVVLSPTEDAVFVSRHTKDESWRLARFEIGESQPTWGLDIASDELAISSDGQKLAVPVISREIQIVETRHGLIQNQIEPTSYDGPLSMAYPEFGNGGAFLLTGSNNRLVGIWDATSGRTIARHDVAQRGGRPHLAASPTEPLIVITEHLKTTVFRVSGADVLSTIAAETFPIKDIDSDREGRQIATLRRRTIPGDAFKGWEFEAWDVVNRDRNLATNIIKESLSGLPDEPVIRFTPDGNRLVSRDMNGRAFVVPLNSPTRAQLDSTLGHQRMWISASELSLGESNSSRKIESSSADEADLWEIALEPGSPLRLDLGRPAEFAGVDRFIHVYLVGRHGTGQSATHAKVSSRSRMHVNQESVVRWNQDESRAMWLGPQIISKNRDLEIEVDLTPSPTSILLEGVWITTDKLSEVPEDLPTNLRELWRTTAHPQTGELWTIFGDEHLRVVDRDRFNLQHTWTNESISHATKLGTIEPLLATENWVVSGSVAGELFVFDAYSHEQESSEFYRQSDVRSLAAIVDENKLLVGYDDGSIQLLQLPKLEIEQTLDHFDLSVESLCYDSTRQWLWAGSHDGTLAMWKYVDGELEHCLDLNLMLGPIQRIRYLPEADCIAILVKDESAVRILQLEEFCWQLHNMDLLPTQP